MKYENILNNGYLYNLWQGFVINNKQLEKSGMFSIHGSTSNKFTSCKKASVLDIGCGPATRTHYFLDTEYFGIDINPQNINMALKRYSNYSDIHFICQDLNDYVLQFNSEHKFDLILMDGVLHHINDDEAKKCLDSIKQILTGGGIFRSLDPVVMPNLGITAQWAIKHDRGKFIRTEKEYLNLVSPCFSNVSSSVDYKIYRFSPLVMITGCLS